MSIPVIRLVPRQPAAAFLWQCGDGPTARKAVREIAARLTACGHPVRRRQHVGGSTRIEFGFDRTAHEKAEIWLVIVDAAAQAAGIKGGILPEEGGNPTLLRPDRRRRLFRALAAA